MDEDTADTSIAHDRGYASRKLWFCVFACLLIVIAAKYSPTVTIPTVVAGLVTIVGIYVTGRSIVQWQAGNIERTQATVNGPVNKVIDKIVEKAAQKELDVDDRG